MEGRSPLSLYPGRQLYETTDCQVVVPLTISMMVLVSRVGGVPQEMGLQDGAKPDQLPLKLQILKHNLNSNSPNNLI